MNVKGEFARRATLKQRLEAYLKARPGVWIPMHELAAVGGLGGWRTRLSELGRREVEPLRIEHNGKNGAASEHRYVPYEPLGRDATVPTLEQWSIHGAPYGPELFELTSPK